MTARATNQALLSVTGIAGTFRDVAAFNLEVENIRGPFSGGRGTVPVEALPGRIDSVEMSTRRTGRPRDVIVEGHVVSSEANLTADIRALTGWCARADALRTYHDTASALLCRMEGEAAVEVLQPKGPKAVARFAATFRAVDPRWYALTASAITFTTNTAMPLGDAIVEPVIRITGAFTDPTIVLKNAAGATIETLVLDVTSPGASDYVEIDCKNQTIIQVISAVETDAIDALTGGSGYFFALDPNDADTITPTWPSLSISYGSGTPTAVAHFRKAWY